MHNQRVLIVCQHSCSAERKIPSQHLLKSSGELDQTKYRKYQPLEKKTLFLFKEIQDMKADVTYSEDGNRRPQEKEFLGFLRQGEWVAERYQRGWSLRLCG